MEFDIEKITKIVDGVLKGNKSIIVRGIASLDAAQRTDIVVFYDLKFIDELLNSKCCAVVIPEGLMNNKKIKGKITKTIIVVKNARVALMKILDIFYGKQQKLHPNKVHSTAILHSTVKLGKNVGVGEYVVVEQNTVIDNGTAVYPHCYIGKDVKIGKNCLIFPNVAIYKGTIIGDNVIIYSGTVIGSDGFGYVTLGNEHKKILQAGIVQIYDNVEIGANVAIDRATIGKTVIGKGTKIDNLVHIAHSVKIGKNCLITGQVGIAGSANIGDNVMMGGQVGIADHVIVGNKAVIAAQSGVIGNVKSGSIITGFPARPIKEFMRAQAALYRWIDKKRLPNK